MAACPTPKPSHPQDSSLRGAANVKAVSIPGETPLHKTCYWAKTNLDFVELLLEGADQMPRIIWEYTVDVYHPYAPSAAKFLLNWPTTDANVTARAGAVPTVKVRTLVECLLRAVSPDNLGTGPRPDSSSTVARDRSVGGGKGLLISVS
jgi:hypothetical protein